MKTKLTSFILLTCFGFAFNAMAQDPDSAPVPLQTESTVAAMRPGAFKINKDWLPQNELTYKASLISGTIKSDDGTLKIKYVTNDKKKTITIISVAEGPNEKRTDTSVVNAETFQMLYHSVSVPSKKSFRNFTRPDGPEDIYFDGENIGSVIALIPDEQMQPVTIAVYDFNERAKATFALMNVKDESLGGAGASDGTYINDVSAGKMHYRIILNKNNRQITRIEISRPDGTLAEYKLNK